MKLLIFGGGGMLGHKLVEKLSERFSVWTTVKSDLQRYADFGIYSPEKTLVNLDVRDERQIYEAFGKLKPDVVINAVGIIKQLPSSKDTIQTLLVNSIFPQRLAEIASEFDSRLLTFSTDCVFSGLKGNYVEADAPDALDLYGRSKNFGELNGANCLTLRTSIIGRELRTKHSLVEWFLSNAGSKVKGYRNAVFSGFPTILMAEIVADIILNHQDLHGLYHLSSAPINKFDLLNLLKKEYKIAIEIEADEDFVIDRSLDSTRFRTATGFEPKSWSEMIETMAADNSLY